MPRFASQRKTQAIRMAIIERQARVVGCGARQNRLHFPLRSAIRSSLLNTFTDLGNRAQEDAYMSIRRGPDVIVPSSGPWRVNARSSQVEGSRRGLWPSRFRREAATAPSRIAAAAFDGQTTRRRFVAGPFRLLIQEGSLLQIALDCGFATRGSGRNGHKNRNKLGIVRKQPRNMGFSLHHSAGF